MVAEECLQNKRNYVVWVNGGLWGTTCSNLKPYLAVWSATGHVVIMSLRGERALDNTTGVHS